MPGKRSVTVNLVISQDQSLLLFLLFLFFPNFSFSCHSSSLFFYHFTVIVLVIFRAEHEPIFE
ncbi:hypothetical protein BDV37DRAFT_101488 [Aspergillus pseudonomiae]|uniref:Uncharacterized protein n=1 Tax=Aspergillus pseudonomiae TaxID=1506151 RepID=A0A5N7DG89_9EURO|nr:uncharacterized protein BDV37DRAFT_101488 [Aspergillus pseudonomiae]KAE8405053.1 hypothetical protein BDV37DRAFT_101488 [Aspergillus pseudonomiae]